MLGRDGAPNKTPVRRLRQRSVTAVLPAAGNAAQSAEFSSTSSSRSCSILRLPVEAEAEADAAAAALRRRYPFVHRVLVPLELAMKRDRNAYYEVELG